MKKPCNIERRSLSKPTQPKAATTDHSSSSTAAFIAIHAALAYPLSHQPQQSRPTNMHHHRHSGAMPALQLLLVSNLPTSKSANSSFGTLLVHVKGFNPCSDSACLAYPGDSSSQSKLVNVNCGTHRPFVLQPTTMTNDTSAPASVYNHRHCIAISTGADGKEHEQTPLSYKAACAALKLVTCGCKRRKQ